MITFATNTDSSSYLVAETKVLRERSFPVFRWVCMIILVLRVEGHDHELMPGAIDDSH
jgi:hypothetical protein